MDLSSSQIGAQRNIRLRRLIFFGNVGPHPTPLSCCCVEPQLLARSIGPLESPDLVRLTMQRIRLQRNHDTEKDCIDFRCHRWPSAHLQYVHQSLAARRRLGDHKIWALLRQHDARELLKINWRREWDSNPRQNVPRITYRARTAQKYTEEHAGSR
jgi:hypothetical protein